VRNVGVNEQMSDKLTKRDHLRAAGNRATGTLVRSTLFELSLTLPLARTPVVGDGLRYPFIEVGHLVIHSCNLRPSLGPLLCA
jgi:hypothetical protein